MLSPYANYTAVDEAPPAPDPEGELNEELRAIVVRELSLLHCKFECGTAHGV